MHDSGCAGMNDSDWNENQVVRVMKGEDLPSRLRAGMTGGDACPVFELPTFPSASMCAASRRRRDNPEVESIAPSLGLVPFP